jgi:hypothetical protein
MSCISVADGSPSVKRFLLALDGSRTVRCIKVSVPQPSKLDSVRDAIREVVTVRLHGLRMRLVGWLLHIGHDPGDGGDRTRPLLGLQAIQFRLRAGEPFCQRRGVL